MDAVVDLCRPPGEQLGLDGVVGRLVAGVDPAAPETWYLRRAAEQAIEVRADEQFLVGPVDAEQAEVDVVVEHPEGRGEPPVGCEIGCGLPHPFDHRQRGGPA